MNPVANSINGDGVLTQHYIDSNGVMHERMTADISNLLKQNKLKRDYTDGYTDSRDMRQLAELDMLTVFKLKSEHNIDVWNPDDMPRLKKWLKENPAFMTVNKI